MRLDQYQHPELYAAVGSWLRGEMLTRIGSELRRRYRLPRGLPHQLLALLIQLGEDHAVSRPRRRRRLSIFQ
jgi:hypothetical protein